MYEVKHNKYKNMSIQDFRTRDSNADSDFNIESNEPFDLPDNTVCYVDDISIPHTWRTIESHNKQFYIMSKWSISLVVVQP